MRTQAVVNESAPNYQKTDFNLSGMDNEPDILAIKQAIAATEKFQSDPDNFQQLLTEHATIVNVVGFRVTGRDEIAYIMHQALQTHMADIITRNELDRITFVRPDVAVVTGLKHIFVRTAGVLAQDSKANQTFILVKEQERWLIAAIQSTLIQQ